MSNGANVVATIDATYENDTSLDINVSSNDELNIDFGAIFAGGECKVLYDTTANWNAKPQLKAAKGYLYVYSDWKTDLQGRKIAGIKVGDGLAYLIDMPFTDQIWADHADDIIRHITQAEREFWNNKVRCYYNGAAEAVIFTTD